MGLLLLRRKRNPPALFTPIGRWNAVFLNAGTLQQLLSVIGKDTLARADILSADDPIMKYIETHETGMFYPDGGRPYFSAAEEKRRSGITCKTYRSGTSGPCNTLTGHI